MNSLGYRDLPKPKNNEIPKELKDAIQLNEETETS
jgi:hypothetical protein